MEAPTRKRMAVEDRREHLLQAGVDLLRHRPYQDVSIEEIAEAAGVSKGLLYHYFPDKKAFIIAALERGQAQLSEELRPDPELAPLASLDAGLDAFLDSVEEHPSAYSAIFKRGGSDRDVAATLEAGRRQQLRLLVEAVLALDDPALENIPTPVLEAALQGWLFFCEGAVLHWLEHGGFGRKRLRVMLRSALLGSISAASRSGAGQP